MKENEMVLAGRKDRIAAIVRNVTEYRETEESLRWSEERAHLLFEASPDSIIILDREGVIVDCNPAALRLYDRPAKSMLGRPFTFFIPPSKREDFQEAFRQLQQGQPQDREIRVPGPAGEEMTIWYKGVPLVDAAGKFNGALVYGRDITTRKRAEAELRKLSRAVEQSASAIIITDREGKIEFVNPAFSRITGYSAQEALGQNPRILKSGKHPPEFYREMWNTLIRGETWRGELVNRKKSGELYWEVATTSPVKDETGEVTHYVAVKEDVTARKRAEEALRIRQQQQQVLNTLLQISLQDLSLTEQLERVLEEVLTIPWLSFLPQGGIFLVEKETGMLVLRAQRNLKPNLRGGCVRLPSVAAPHQIQLTNQLDERYENAYADIMPRGHYSVPILSGEEMLGIIVFYLPEGHQEKESEVAFLQAIANTLAGMIKRKQAEEALVEAHKQAMEASRLKSRILSVANHDIRSSLAIFLVYLDLLREGIYGPLSGKQQEITSRMTESINYLLGLVDDLLTGAQLESGRLELRITPFDLRQAVNQVENRMGVLACKKGLTLTFEIASDMPVLLLGDMKRVQQILSNLIGNAIKFTDTGSVQTRIYCSDLDHWAIQVTDTGSGIPPEAQTRIFNAFQQIDDASHQRRSGFGLGLSIVKQLAEMMDGEVVVESEPGQGSTFTIIFPLLFP